MNPDEKIQTLNNRMIKLKERQLLMMEEIKESEALYPISGAWQDKVQGSLKEMYPSDDNMSNLSGYSSSGVDMRFHSNQLMQGLEELKQGLEEYKSSTADDTESVA